MFIEYTMASEEKFSDNFGFTESEVDISSIEEILAYAHNTETPILSYNNEVELSSIVNLVYLSARDRYRVEREDKARIGYNGKLKNTSAKWLH